MTALRVRRSCRRPAAAEVREPRRSAAPDGKLARLPAPQSGRRGRKVQIPPWSRSGWLQGLPERPRAEPPKGMARPAPRGAMWDLWLARPESGRPPEWASARAQRLFRAHRDHQAPRGRGRIRHGLARRGALHSVPRWRAASWGARCGVARSEQTSPGPILLQRAAVRRRKARAASGRPEA